MVLVTGINVENITLSKSVTLKGMNGLKNGVVIESFDLPENDPSGGIHLTLNTTITNVSRGTPQFAAGADLMSAVTSWHCPGLDCVLELLRSNVPGTGRF